jgi:two-component system sensor histidine kinase/response regulator
MVAQRLAHTLKSVSGTLAASDLQHSAAALELALRGGRTGEAPMLAQRLVAVLDPLMNGLSQWLRLRDGNTEGATTSGPPTEGSGLGPSPSDLGIPEAHLPAARRLLELLTDLDPEASESAAELASGLPADHPLQGVASKAAGYDFDEARMLLDKLLSASTGATA